MARGNSYGIPLIITANTAGAKKADKSLKSLIKSTKSFGLTSKLSIGAASVALTAYTKRSIGAALADQKAQKSLAQTLKNLGLQYQTVGVTKYIDNLQRATGVSEDELRPAFQKLLLVLGDVGKAQSALSLAMDISAGTGKDLSAVSMALAKGYSGQTTALSRLGAGLDKALLKSGDMEAITAQLSKLFAGQALTAAKTYAGQMAILAVSAKEASETIGFALINSLIDLGGQDGAKTLASQMEATAVATSEVIAGLTVMIGKLKSIPIIKNLGGGFSPIGIITNAIRGLGRKSMAAKASKTDANAFDRGLNNRAVDLATKIVAKKKEAAKIDKGAAATSKLQGMFDIDAIQIAAALKGKISDLDRATLEGMQALKTKGTDDDIAAIKKIEYETLRANAAANDSQHLALMNTFDFYESIYGAAKKASDKIQQLSFVPSGMAAPIAAGGGGGYQGMPSIGNITQPNAFADMGNMGNVGFDLASFGQGQAAFEAGIASYQAAQQSTVVVNVNPSGSGFIGNQDDFLRTVQMALQIGGRNGYSTSGLATG